MSEVAKLTFVLSGYPIARRYCMESKLEAVGIAVEALLSIAFQNLERVSSMLLRYHG